VEEDGAKSRANRLRMIRKLGREDVYTVDLIVAAIND
jgi:hypothetical protein